MKRLLATFCLLLLTAYAATGIYQVQPGEVAVVRRFGRVLDDARLPGLNVGLPWGLDRVDRVSVDEQRQIVVGFPDSPEQNSDVPPAGQVLTGDNHLIDVRATIYYRVDRETPGAVVQYVLNADRIEGVLLRAAEEALAATLAGQRVDSVLLGRAKNLEPLLQEHLVIMVREYWLGVAIESVNLAHVQPPAEVADVFRAVNRARTQKEIAEREALIARQTEVSVARQHSRKVLTDAEAAHRDRVSRAQAEADNFLALWQKHNTAGAEADNALLTLYLREMQTVLSRFQVRTLSDPKVDQTIIMPLPDR